MSLSKKMLQVYNVFIAYCKSILAQEQLRIHQFLISGIVKLHFSCLLPELFNIAMSKVDSAALLRIPKGNCVSSCCILSLLATETNTERLARALYFWRRVAGVTSSVVRVFHQLHTKGRCNSDKPSSWYWCFRIFGYC